MSFTEYTSAEMVLPSRAMYDVHRFPGEVDRDIVHCAGKPSAMTSNPELICLDKSSKQLCSLLLKLQKLVGALGEPDETHDGDMWSELEACSKLCEASHKPFRLRIH